MQIDEPWKIDEYYVVDKEGCYIGLVGEMGGEECARRIVACVNACRSVSDEDLADDCVEKMRADRDGLLAQRDELLAALKVVLDPESDMDAAFKKAYDAIHRVENA